LKYDTHVSCLAAEDATATAAAKAKADSSAAQVAAMAALNQHYLDQAAAVRGAATRGRPRRTQAIDPIPRLPAPPTVGSIAATRRGARALAMLGGPAVSVSHEVNVGKCHPFITLFDLPIHGVEGVFHGVEGVFQLLATERCDVS